MTWAVAIGLLVTGVACSGGDDDDGSGKSAGSAVSSSTSEGQSGTTDGSDSTATTTSEGCKGPAPAMGEPASEREVVDVDGDGRRDKAWLSSPGEGVREMGVTTAAGGGDKVVVDSASPVPMTLLVADADETPPVEFLLSDNRTVQLWAFADCKLQQVKDGSGQPYLFDLGFRGYGTGVGCIDADDDGKRDLVGLNVVQRDDTSVEWERTIIERVALRAANGEKDEGRYALPQDEAKVELLSTVTCGNLDLADDGIQQPE